MNEAPHCPTCDRAVLLGWPSGCGCDAGLTFFRVHQSAKLGGSNKSNSCPEIAVLAKLASRPDIPSHLFLILVRAPRSRHSRSTSFPSLVPFSSNWHTPSLHNVPQSRVRFGRQSYQGTHSIHPIFFLAYCVKLPQLPHHADHQPQLQASPIVRLPGATQQRRALSIHEYLSADLLRKVKKT